MTLLITLNELFIITVLHHGTFMMYLGKFFPDWNALGIGVQATKSPQGGAPELCLLVYNPSTLWLFNIAMESHHF